MNAPASPLALSRSAALLALLLLPLLACSPDDTGEEPPQQARCGDGSVNAPTERCDDGNTQAGDGCSADCASDESCGNAKVDLAAGEACDDGNTQGGDGCSADCGTREDCGNGTKDEGEACDDGNTSNADGCLVSCELAACGDGQVDGAEPDVEACDDGNTVTETECAYGTKTCEACSATCSAALDLTGRYCGDGTKNDASEVCDDGNSTTESECPYGQASCTACNATCEGFVSLTGPTCGDGVRNGPEACDDANTLSCGTCSATCTQVQSSSARGTLMPVAGASLQDGETFSITDGINATTVVFELDSNGVKGPGRVAVPFTPAATQTQVAAAIHQAIANRADTFFQFTVVSQSAMTPSGWGVEVLVRHVRAGAFGNRAITDTVAHPDFRVTGLSGGAGGDCSAGTGCTGSDDCAPGLVCSPARTCEVP